MPLQFNHRHIEGFTEMNKFSVSLVRLLGLKKSKYLVQYHTCWLPVAPLARPPIVHHQQSSQENLRHCTCFEPYYPSIGRFCFPRRTPRVQAKARSRLEAGNFEDCLPMTWNFLIQVEWDHQFCFNSPKIHREHVKKLREYEELLSFSSTHHSHSVSAIEERSVSIFI